MSIVTHEPATTIEVPAVSDDEGKRREILLRAAELIETHGWTTGSEGMKVGDGPFCLLGAVGHAAGVRTHWHDNHARYSMVPAAAVLGVGHEDAYQWNDGIRFEQIWLTRPKPGGKKVAAVLRAMANGTSWEDATR